METSDDVDMDDAEWSYQTHWASASLDLTAPGQRSTLVTRTPVQDVRYLAVDTNVLISHFSLFKRLHDHLAQPGGSLDRLILLIPYTVINELDGLGSRGSDDESLGLAACTATAFLLAARRAQTTTDRIVLHCQRWSERNDPSLTKPDDRILDCCLYFRSESLGVSLWTDDRNLALLAESNDVSTIPGRGMTMDRVLERAIGHTDNGAASRTGTESGIGTGRGERADDGGMDVEADLQAMQNFRHGTTFNTTSMTPPTASDAATATAAATTMKHDSSNDTHDAMLIDKDVIVPTTTPDSTTFDPLADIPLPSRISRRTPRPPQALLDDLASAFAPIAASLSLSTSSVSPIRSSQLTRRILEALLELEVQLDKAQSSNSAAGGEGTTERHRLLLRAISALRTTSAFMHVDTAVPASKTISARRETSALPIRDKTPTRRPRTGEVADALLVLAEVLPPLGLAGPDLVTDLNTLAERIRQSL